ncbi:MAG TPA: choice-of-anchor tandem repeat GloVer-containing protein [Candidatus Acidoferrales bacterium]|nr:choice-of-anchor tandem repeat GloVer-containing protein [Candidatus Acidoferrales bacterium]
MNLTRFRYAGAALALAGLGACTGSGAPVPGVSHHTLVRETSSQCAVAGTWSFQGACKYFLMKKSGVTVTLPAYDGITLQQTFQPDSVQPNVHFIVAEGTSDKDITGTVGGKPFPFYGTVGCETFQSYSIPCNGKAFLYLSVSNASDVETFFHALGPFVITNQNGFPGAHCEISQLLTVSGKSKWQQLDLVADPRNGTLSFPASTAFYTFYTPRATTILSFVCNDIPDASNVGGINPSSALLNVDGTLYGTTTTGGSQNGGALYSIAPSGANKSVLYDFPRTGDGPPRVGGGLIEVGGTFYGVTLSGGTLKKGSIFSVSSTGVETVLHSFGGPGDGVNPTGSLTFDGGKLYGVTENGGAYAQGTVYSATLTGTVTILHSFAAWKPASHRGSGYNADGEIPNGGLLDVNGTFYGTTYMGGYHPSSEIHGLGTVFTIAKDGKEKVLYYFGYGKDGKYPSAPLIEVNGIFYGTTTYGGTFARDHHPGDGTVFSITPSGTEKVLHNFNFTDGDVPGAPLVELNGLLYGTTIGGGPKIESQGGTVFSITPGGVLKTLHKFGSEFYDGKVPATALTVLNGTLYGTTIYGGQYGAGTVFSIKPGGAERVVYSFGAQQ